MRKHPFAECESCPLQDAPHVATLFPKRSNGLAVLGESPGRQEKLKGIPFTGPSGQLLDKSLEVHNIKREETLLSNAALCNYADGDKHLLPKAIECCRPRLLHELKQANINTAITFGNAAKDSLVDTKDGIMKARGGPAKESSYLSGLKVVTTLHPAFCLRDQGKFPLMLNDIAKIYSKEPLWHEPIITVIEDAPTAIKVLNSSTTTSPLVLDVETGKEKEEQYGRTTNLLCVGLGSTSNNHGNRVVVIGRPAIYDPNVQDTLCSLLERTGIIGQNAKFDIYQLSLINHHNRNLWLHYDTMLASYSLNETPGTHGLKYMGVEELGTPHWEDEIKKYLTKPKDDPDTRQSALHWIQSALADGAYAYRTDMLRESPVSEAATKRAAIELGVLETKGSEGEKYANRIRWSLPPVLPEIAPPDADGSYASIPAPILHKYNAFDVQVTRQLYFLFRARQNSAGLTEFNEHLMRMSNALMRVERNGLRVDRAFNGELYRQFSEHIDSLRPNFEGINPGSVKQLKRFISEEYDRDLDSTAEEAIVNEINTVGKRYPAYKQFCENLLEFRQWTKLRSTYVTSVARQADENNDFVLPTFKIDQATTGRLASKNPNVQNMPRQFDIKRQFIPSSPDRVFVHADYSQLELRVITWLSGDEGIRALFNDPSRDVFDELAASVYGIDPSEFQLLKQTKPKEAKEMRVVVKSFAYGIIYGRTAYGIAQDPDLDITIQEAERVSQLFQAQIPGIMAFQQTVIDQIHKGKDLINIFGRHRRFHLITNQNKHDLEKQAMAFLPQSTASDICVTALSRLPEHFDPRNIIHDAILLEAPRDQASEIGKELSRIMIETAEEITNGYIRFDVDYDIGEHWADV